MRLAFIIIISAIFFASCKSSFTKRHYRPGIFKEHIKEIQGFSKKRTEGSLSRTYELYTPNSSNKNSGFVKDTVSEKFNPKYILEGQLKYKSKAKVRKANSKIRTDERKIISYDEEESKVEKLRNKRKFIIYIALGLSFMIVLFLPLAFLVPSLLGAAFIGVLIYVGILILLGLLYVIFTFIISIKQEVDSNEAEKLSYEDESSWRFSKNMQRLGYLKWLVLISLAIGVIFLFIYLRTAAFFLAIGFLFSFVAAIRLIALVASYRKCKKSLTQEEIEDYKKLKRFLALLFLVFLLAGALSVLILF